MNPITQLVNKMAMDGYTDSFKVTARGLYSCVKGRYYRPEQVRITDFYQLEGQVDPGGHTNMYVIETSDGVRGTLINAQGVYSDGNVDTFISEVEDIRKKVMQNEF